MAESTHYINNDYIDVKSVVSELDDDALLSSFNANDHACFTGIYNRLFSPVFYFACRIVGHDEALDKTAETFYKLWRMEKKFASIHTIKTWCQVTVRNDCINYLRRNTMRQAEEKNIIALIDTATASYDDDLVKAEFLQLIEKEIDKLPAQCKKIFRLAYFDELREKQIAAQLRISVHTVRNHKARALKILRFSLPLSLLLAVFLKIFFSVH